MRRAVRLAAVLTIALAGCSHFSTPRWPWARASVPPLESANELVITPGEGTVAVGFPQYWKRNTLVIDLQSISGSGSAVLQRRADTEWPVRLALRIRPGQVGVLEVQGEQRAILPIAPEGAQPIDLELFPALYTPETTRLTVSWEPPGRASQSRAGVR